MVTVYNRGTQKKNKSRHRKAFREDMSVEYGLSCTLRVNYRQFMQE